MYKNNIIFIADSDRDLIERLSINIGMDGCFIKKYFDGRGIAKDAEEFQPAVIILNDELQYKDGLTILRELKYNPTTKHIPVIIITSSNDLNYIKEFLIIGVKDFLLKPFNLNELNKRIEKLIYYEEILKSK